MTARAQEWPTTRIRFVTQREPSAERVRQLSRATRVTFLPMEAIGEQGELDLSDVRDIEEVRVGYTLFFDGDVIVAKITPCFENGKGALVRGTLNGVGYGTTELHILTPSNNLDGRFLYFITASKPFRLLGEANMTGTAGQKRVPEEFVRDYRIRVPPIADQRAIASYLDRETARVDAMILAKERVLALLAEKRRALVTRAVTRGLEPRTEFRESGIPWLGRIPGHWNAVALRFLVDFFGGATPDTGNQVLWGGSIPWVSPKDMKQAEIADAEDHVSSAALSESPLRLIDPPAVLVVVRGMILAHSFPTATTTKEVTINQDMKALRCREVLDPYFLRDYFVGVESHLLSLVDTAAHGTRKLETEVLGRCEVCVPPRQEQREIVAYLARESAKINDLCGATQRTISLLKERRAAIIDAALTGTIKVETAA